MVATAERELIIRLRAVAGPESKTAFRSIVDQAKQAEAQQANGHAKTAAGFNGAQVAQTKTLTAETRKREQEEKRATAAKAKEEARALKTKKQEEERARKDQERESLAAQRRSEQEGRRQEAEQQRLAKQKEREDAAEEKRAQSLELRKFKAQQTTITQRTKIEETARRKSAAEEARAAAQSEKEQAGAERNLERVQNNRVLGEIKLHSRLESIGESALQGARGIAIGGAMNQKDADQMLRYLVGIQAGYDVIRGGTSLVNTGAKAWVQWRKNAETARQEASLLTKLGRGGEALAGVAGGAGVVKTAIGWGRGLFGLGSSAASAGSGGTAAVAPTVTAGAAGGTMAVGAASIGIGLAALANIASWGDYATGNKLHANEAMGYAFHKPLAALYGFTSGGSRVLERPHYKEEAPHDPTGAKSSLWNAWGGLLGTDLPREIASQRTTERQQAIYDANQERLRLLKPRWLENTEHGLSQKGIAGESQLEEERLRRANYAASPWFWNNNREKYGNEGASLIQSSFAANSQAFGRREILGKQAKESGADFDKAFATSREGKGGTSEEVVAKGGRYLELLHQQKDAVEQNAQAEMNASRAIVAAIQTRIAVLDRLREKGRDTWKSAKGELQSEKEAFALASPEERARMVMVAKQVDKGGAGKMSEWALREAANAPDSRISRLARSEMASRHEKEFSGAGMGKEQESRMAEGQRQERVASSEKLDTGKKDGNNQPITVTVSTAHTLEIDLKADESDIIAALTPVMQGLNKKIEETARRIVDEQHQINQPAAQHAQSAPNATEGTQ